jgi:hypothetical protein
MGLKVIANPSPSIYYKAIEFLRFSNSNHKQSRRFSPQAYPLKKYSFLAAAETKLFICKCLSWHAIQISQQ